MHALISLLKSPYMVVWHVTTEIMIVIICLLEDEQELSLGMLVRPKHIYNFCLLHVLDELSYTFDHIWTNLLTQCTPVLVPVFCCFSISGFPHIKSAPKFQEKSNKKSAQKKLRESPRGADGTHQGLRRPPGAP